MLCWRTRGRELFPARKEKLRTFIRPRPRPAAAAATTLQITPGRWREALIPTTRSTATVWGRCPLCVPWPEPSSFDGHGGFDLFAYERAALAGNGDRPFDSRISNRSTPEVAGKRTPIRRLFKRLLKQQVWSHSKNEIVQDSQLSSGLLYFCEHLCGAAARWDQNTGIKRAETRAGLSVFRRLRPIFYINRRRQTLLARGPSRHRLSKEPSWRLNECPWQSAWWEAKRHPCLASQIFSVGRETQSLRCKMWSLKISSPPPPTLIMGHFFWSVPGTPGPVSSQSSRSRELKWPPAHPVLDELWALSEEDSGTHTWQPTGDGITGCINADKTLQILSF